MIPTDELVLRGPAPLGDAQLLAVVLGGSEARAARVLAAVGGVHRLGHLGAADGPACRVGARSLARLRAAVELGRRALAVPLGTAAPIATAAQVAAHLRPRLAHREQEEVHVLGLDGAHRVIHHHVAAVGGSRQVWVEAVDVFRPLVRAGAVVAIVVHNHPSGSPAPSDADAQLTDRLARAGHALGIPLLDHVILARAGLFSFCEAGRLGPLHP